MNIYAGNLPYGVDSNELREVFSQYGKVDDASVISDRFSGRSKGFGFVVMPDDTEAEAAIEALNEKDYKGRTLRVNRAKPREEN